MGDIYSQVCNKKLKKERSLATLDKINSGISVMAVVFLIFRKQFESLNTKEAQTVINYLRNSVPSLKFNSALEEISIYLQTLSQQEFSSLIKQLVIVCQSSKDLSSAN